MTQAALLPTNEGVVVTPSARSVWDDMSPTVYEEAIYANPLLGSVFREELIRANECITSETVLIEIGCGTGRFCLSFLRRVHHIVGIDTSQRALDYLASRAESHRDEISLINGDAAQLACLLRDGAVDLPTDFQRRERFIACVMNTLGIMTPKHRVAVLAEMIHSSAPNGNFLLVVFNGDYFEKGVNEFYRKSPLLCGDIVASDVDWEHRDIRVSASGYSSHWFLRDELWRLLRGAGATSFTIEASGIALFATGR